MVLRNDPPRLVIIPQRKDLPIGTLRGIIRQAVKEFPPNAMIVLGRTFSPNPDKPPFYADMPKTLDEVMDIMDFGLLIM